MNKRTVFKVLTVIMTAFILSNSLKTAEVSSESSGRIVTMIIRFCEWLGYSVSVENMQHIVRKTAHFLEFSAHGFLLSECFSRTFRERAVYVLFFGLLTACMDEFLQLFFDGRGSQIQDVFLDFFGTMWGLVFSGIIEYIRRKRI